VGFDGHAGLAGVVPANHDGGGARLRFGSPGQGPVMRGLIILCGILGLCVLASGTLPAFALPLSEFSRVYPYLVRKAQICLLTRIPTQANPVRDATLLAEMRRRLPDTFACGRCRYDLAGDQGAAYYLKTCR
jgi:hypothetical protein